MFKSLNIFYCTLLFVLLLNSTGIFAEENIALSPEEKAMIEATVMVVDKENNTITYISPDETNDINVKIDKKFVDVPENAWYQCFLSHLVQLGIIQGVNENQFAPYSYVTRAEFASMLAHASDVDLSIYQGKSSFEDVSVTAWYAPQIEWAYQEGLIKGYTQELFLPDAYLTREQAAVLIERYAIVNKSEILDANQYELSEESISNLTEAEIKEINELLEMPEYVDQENVSEWAEKSVEEMSRSGIICGNEKGEFNPADFLYRSECVKIISAYIVNNTKPTFIFPGGSFIEYLPSENETTDLTDEELKDLGIESFDDTLHGDNFYIEVSIDDQSTEGLTLKWGTLTHKTVTDLAYELLKDNTGEGGRLYIYNKLKESVSSNGATGIYLIKKYAWYTDKIENQNNKFYSHFYNPDTRASYNNSTSVNAYWYFNNHFYDAYTSYKNGDKYSGYMHLGMAIHYLEDLNNPYHASNKTTSNSNHSNYEDWANNVAANHSTTMSYSSYRFVYDSSFRAMSDNFAGLAKDSYGICSIYNSTNAATMNAARVATVNNLSRTERAVCGLLNRFYYNAGLNN